MENHLFDAIMPYYAELLYGEITVFNHSNVILFRGKLPKRIDFEKILEFSADISQFDPRDGGKVYLYDITPVGYSQEIFNYDFLIDYYKRLTHLFEFCSGIKCIGENKLLRM